MYKTNELFTNKKINRKTIKNRIIKEKLIPYRCFICGNEGIWQNKKMVLELHHIDGKKENGNFENLQFLCPNCHSQTENWKKNKKKKEE